STRNRRVVNIPPERYARGRPDVPAGNGRGPDRPRRCRSSPSLEAVQAQAVGDDRDAGKRHGRPGDDGVEDAECGEGDGGDVVAERPAQVLEDGAEGAPGQAEGGDHAVEVTGQEGDVGRFDGDIGAGPDGDAQVGLNQGRRVVDPVADHGDDPA